jgi:hypothetical protein
VTSTLGRELVSTQSPHAEGNMSRKLGPLAALAMVTLIGVGCSNAPAENGNAGNTNAGCRNRHRSALRRPRSRAASAETAPLDPTENGPLINLEGALVRGRIQPTDGPAPRNLDTS